MPGVQAARVQKYWIPILKGNSSGYGSAAPIGPLDKLEKKVAAAERTCDSVAGI